MVPDEALPEIDVSELAQNASGLRHECVRLEIHRRECGPEGAAEKRTSPLPLLPSVFGFAPNPSCRDPGQLFDTANWSSAHT